MNKIKNSIRFGLLIASLCCGFLLTSCVIEPQMFGVPQSQWNQLSEEQQQEVIRGYNEKQRIDATNEPINRAIGAHLPEGACQLLNLISSSTDLRFFDSSSATKIINHQF